MKRRINQLFLSGAFLVVVLLLFDGQANADVGSVTDCTVGSVFTDGYRLKLTCTGGAWGTFYVNPGPECPASNMDTVKVFQSIITAAFLAGKVLDISFVQFSGACVDKTVTFLAMYNHNP